MRKEDCILTSAFQSTPVRDKFIDDPANSAYKPARNCLYLSVYLQHSI